MIEKVTKKRFYGKWLYKVSLRMKGAAAFRIHSVEHIISICSGVEPKGERGYPYYLDYDVWKNKKVINKVIHFASLWPKKEWQKRIEGDIFDIYTNNKKLYNNAKLEFKEYIREVSAPSSKSMDILDDPKSIAVKKLPHNKYRYKVFLQPHRMSKDENDKRQYLEWLKGQKGIKITPAVEDWFVKTSWNWDRRYVLVENEQILLMLNLKNPRALGTVHKYVISDK